MLRIETLFRILLAGSVFTAVITLSSTALAKGGGGGNVQLGLSLGRLSSDQEHMNTLISSANTREGGISTPQMAVAYEGAAHIGYRFNGSIIALMLRPSYFYQQADGGNNAGAYNYGIRGYTIFPMVRIYPLENDFMKFFMHIGIGYGHASGSIEEEGARADFSGDAFGTVAGLGSEFCYAARHCLSVEGNIRYLTMERNIVSNVSGTFDAQSPISQAEKNREIEMNGTDLAARLGGLQVLAGYSFYF